jgi:hypothetical protein
VVARGALPRLAASLAQPPLPEIGAPAIGLVLAAEMDMDRASTRRQRLHKQPVAIPSPGLQLY